MDRAPFSHCFNLLNSVCGLMTASSYFTPEEVKSLADALLKIDSEAYFPMIAYSLALSSRDQKLSAKKWMLRQISLLEDSDGFTSPFLLIEMARAFRENGDYQESRKLCDKILQMMIEKPDMKIGHEMVEIMAMAYLDDFEKGLFDGGYTMASNE